MSGFFILPPRSEAATTSGSTGSLIGTGVIGAGALALYLYGRGLPTFDYANIVGWITKLGLDIQKWAVDDLQKALTDLVAKRMIDYMVDQTVQWIQGGGEPKFVTNWSGFLQDTANIAFDTVVHQVNLARLCSPFGLQVKLALQPTPRLSQQLSCTLDQFTANIQNFYNNFQNGGWLAYGAEWQPNNNYYGQLIMIQDNIHTQVSQDVTAAANEAVSGKGFLSTKKCIAYDRQSIDAGSNGCADQEAACTLGRETCLAQYDSCLVDVTSNAPCTEYQIQTPGSVIADTLSQAVGADSTWAANIRSWTTVLVNAVINRLINEGVGAMQTGFSGSSGSYTGSNAGNYSYYYPPEYQAAATQQLQNQQQNSAGTLQSFLAEKQYLLNDKQQSLSVSQQILTTLQNMQSMTCPTPVSATDISNAQSEIVRLTNDVNNLTADVSNLQNSVNQVQSSQVNNYQAYAQTFNQYNNPAMLLQISTGSARTAADQELAAKKSLLANDQTNASQCTPAGTGPSASSTFTSPPAPITH